MNAATQTPMDEKLLSELREMAQQGQRAKDLVAHIERRLGLPAHSMVHVLAYLCRAFSVPLPVLLPLREDEGQGPFGRAAEVLFWFATLLRDGHNVASWNWDIFWQAFGGDFDPNLMKTERMERGWLQIMEPPNWMGNVYVRGAFEVYVDKVEAFGPEPMTVFRDLREFANAFHNRIDVNSDEPIQLNLEYKVEEQGPKYRVVCLAQALRYARNAEAAPA